MVSKSVSSLKRQNAELKRLLREEGVTERRHRTTRRSSGLTGLRKTGTGGFLSKKDERQLKRAAKKTGRFLAKKGIPAAGRAAKATGRGISRSARATGRFARDKAAPFIKKEARLLSLKTKSFIANIKRKRDDRKREKAFKDRGIKIESSSTDKPSDNVKEDRREFEHILEYCRH